MSPRKGAAEIAVSRTDEVLTLRMLSEGVVYELSEDIGLGCWEARHWEEGADVAELSAGDTEQRAMSGFFPEPIEEEFEAELSRRSVRDVRMEPLARFRGLLDQGRWHEASQLGVRIAMDPYVSAGPGEREAYTHLAQAAALVAANELEIERAATEASRLGGVDE